MEYIEYLLEPRRVSRDHHDEAAEDVMEEYSEFLYQRYLDMNITVLDLGKKKMKRREWEDESDLHPVSA